MYVDQFDEVCESVYAEQLKDKLDNVMETYKLYTDNTGHTYFMKTNVYGPAVAAEFEISSGEAQQLHFSAKEHLRRTGGYDNPAD